MPRIPPRTTDGLRAAAAIGGIASIVAGSYDSRWIPALGCLAVVTLSVTEFALARVRRWLAGARAREERQLAQVTARQGGPTRREPEDDETSDALLRLLEAVHQELNLANEEAARARADLADLTREWNALVQESLCRQLGFCGPPGPDRPSPGNRPRPPGPPGHR
ncbi:hypothetical protein [Kitasatospora sp. NBC_00315]|uniref:hypothetical protein n=1 Tax=Kitasatospora sp. NBC_00315 TaxID=2975963 RepID=UPI003244D032